jgi:hypothetical protein
VFIFSSFFLRSVDLMTSNISRFDNFQGYSSKCDRCRGQQATRYANQKKEVGPSEHHHDDHHGPSEHHHDDHHSLPTGSAPNGMAAAIADATEGTL